LEFCDFHLWVGSKKFDSAVTEPLFSSLARYGYTWQKSGPNKSGYWIGEKKRLMKGPVKGAEFSKVLKIIESSDSCLVNVSSDKTRHLYLGFGNSETEGDSSLGRITVSTLMVYFDREEGGSDENAKSFFSLCRDICIEIEPLYARGDWEEWVDLDFPSDGQIKEGRIDRVLWLNCFGPETASIIGRRLLTTADWHSIETLPYGGILASAYLNPRNDPFSNGLERIKRIEAHLGIHHDS